MIKKLSVKNFQSIEYAEIDLSDGINAFIGESNYGKTALASRTIKILLYNSVFPERMVTHGQSSCSIIAEIINPINNEIIILERHKKSNTSYFVLNGLKLEKSGSSTGISILKEHCGVEFSNLNMQEQHNPHYFITMSPTEAGVELMKFFDLSEQNIMKDRIAKIQRDNKVIYQNTLNKIDNLTLKIEANEKIKKDIDSYISILENIENDVSKSSILDNELNSYNNQLRYINELSSKKITLEKYQVDLYNIEKSINLGNSLITSLSYLKDNSKYSNISISILNDYSSKISSYINIYDQSIILINTLTSLGTHLYEYHKLTSELKDYKAKSHGMVCPTCNQIIK